MITWFVARHILYLRVCYSIWKDTQIYVPHACFIGSNGNMTGPHPFPEGWSYLLEPFRAPQGMVCFSDGINWSFLSALLSLQVLTIFWFMMIIRVAVRVLKGANADDDRSDDEARKDESEEEEIEEEQFEYAEAQPLEEEVGVEAIDFKGWERRAGVKRAASTTGVSLPGHSDRKELLGRIGCEKQVD
jgi:very-long-chain ceramide synthase